MNRICCVCKESLDLELFERKKGKPFDKGYRCKKCANGLSKKYREEHKEYFKKYLQEYGKTYVKKHHRKYKRVVTEARREYIKLYWKTHKKELTTQKIRARVLFNHHVQTGKIKKGSCFVCGNAIAEAHHPDYSKPFNVLWLCREHHAKLHAELKIQVL